MALRLERGEHVPNGWIQPAHAEVPDGHVCEVETPRVDGRDLLLVPVVAVVDGEGETDPYGHRTVPRICAASRRARLPTWVAQRESIMARAASS